MKIRTLPKIILGGAGFLFFAATVHLALTRGILQAGKLNFLLFFMALLCVLSFLFLCTGKETQFNLMVVYVSAGMTVYAVEAYLSYKSYAKQTESYRNQQSRKKEAEKTGVRFDARSPLDVVMDFRHAGIAAYPFVYPLSMLKPDKGGVARSRIGKDGMELLPVGGISNQLTVYCNESGDYLNYESDERGFHNPRGVWDQVNIEIAAIGDSFVHGACVPSDKNFVSLLRQNFPRVLNLGAGGNGPLIELAAVREYLQEKKPKIVLWCYYEGNDIADISIENKSSILMRYMEGDSIQGLSRRQGEIDNALMEYVEDQIAARTRLDREHVEDNVAARARLDLDWERTWGRIGEIVMLTDLRMVLQKIQVGIGTTEGEKDLPVFREILRQAKHIVESWGGVFYFVYLPDYARYKQYFYGNKIRGRVIGIAEELAIPVIDIHESFLRHEDPIKFFPYREAGHYTIEGNRIVAEKILEAIKAGNPGNK